MKFVILVTGGPFDSQRWETAYRIGDAALLKGHKVVFFFYLDSVLIPVKYQVFGEESVPHDRFEDLCNRGAQIILCMVCSDARGIRREDLIENTELRIGGMFDLANIVGEADRVVSL